MISEKILLDEIKAVIKEQKDRIKQKDWPEVARLDEVLCTLKFVRDWNED